MEILDIQSLREKSLPVFEAYGITCCYLFGSRAGEDYYQDSDIDLAVIFRTYSPARHNLDLEIEIQDAISEILAPLEADLLFLQKAPIYLRFTVIKNGKIIYCSDEDFRTDFEDMTVRDYLDFKPVLDRYYREMAEELTAKIAGGPET
ncbi:type VII toxin-antitoxin system MntA family adenylyltransferase antitoxin [Desulfofundulus australicus]|uniref:type VII toxin-antitoxin system MntA family adenylyltransferase antitoxin n=1 Tax=Desulfofundulus australicus TaxID=1566 RepID=UPI0013F4D512|nr:nucleotidyltransferase domain-containing protein [Desulfofundulus australicus]